MPVRVDIPTRVKVDAPVLAERLPELEEALVAAAERALRASATEVLEPRGGYLGVELNAPEFSWSGEALDSVTPVQRAGVEAMLAQAIADAARAAGLPPQPPSDVSAPLAVLPVEPLDEARYNRALGLYSIPAYDDGGGGENGQVDPGDEGAAGEGGILFYGWQPVPLEDAGGVYAETLAQFSIEPPSEGYMGPIFMDPRRGLTFGLYRYPNPDQSVFGTTSIALTNVTYDDASGRWVDRPVELPAMAAYSVDLVAMADAADLDAKIGEFYRPIVRRVMGERRGPLVSNAEFDRAVETRVEAIAASERAAMQGVTALLRLRVNTTSYLMKTRGSLTPPTDLQGARLIPLVHPIAPPGEGEGEGRGTGEGAGVGAEAGEGAEGEGEGEAAQPPGGFVETADGQPAGAMFPPPAPGDPVALECVPYLGEPSLLELGEVGEQMRQLVNRIAWQLQILPCEYAGQFLLNAAAVLGARAGQVARWETTETGTAQAAPASTGNLGHVQFIPTASAQIQFLRHLATTVPLFSDLSSWIEEVYRQRENLIRGTWAGQGVSWLLRWLYDFNSAMGNNVGRIFAMTCQTLFLQLLNSSRQAIEQRQANITQFAQHFSQVIVPQLTRIEELIRAREIIDDAEVIAAYYQSDPEYARGLFPDVRMANVSPAPQPPRTQRGTDWEGSTQAFTSALAIQSEQPPPPEPEPVADHFELVLMVDGSYQLLDKRGHLWATKEQIEAALVLRRGTLEGVEPLVKQLVDLPEVMERFRDPSTSVQAELERILLQMHTSNDQVTKHAKADPYYGFRASRISEHIEGATVPYSRFSLNGVHLTAHQQIGEFFRGDRYYPMGIDDLFMTELGKESLGAFFEFTGIVLLAVVCPPAAAIVGVELAAHHLEVAEERRRVYRSLMNPEEVRSLAEVEAELFAARLGLALSFIPVGGELLAEARAAFGVAARAGAEAAEEVAAAGGRRAALGMADRAAVHLMGVIEHGIVEKFVEELAKAWLINKVIGWSLEPVMAHMQREWSTTGPVGGMQGAMSQLLGRMADHHPAQAHLPPVRIGGTR